MRQGGFIPLIIFGLDFVSCIFIKNFQTFLEVKIEINLDNLTGYQGSNVSTTPITAIRCRQCLSLGFVQLKGKHCQKTHCRNGVVGTFQRCWGLGSVQMLISP